MKAVHVFADQECHWSAERSVLPGVQDQLYRHFRMGTRVDGDFSVTDVGLKALDPGAEGTPPTQRKYCLSFR
jgi:hypothetical protein